MMKKDKDRCCVCGRFVTLKKGTTSKYTENGNGGIIEFICHSLRCISEYSSLDKKYKVT